VIPMNVRTSIELSSEMTQISILRLVSVSLAPMCSRHTKVADTTTCEDMVQ
jgi:hypothetical protein